VSLPIPVPGLIVRYSYLWLNEAREGREDGIKDRPCAIVMALISDDESTDIVVLPITHRKPTDEDDAIEIPQVVKDRLGLDMDRSWIVLSEFNRFTWPGLDLRIIPGHDESSVAYGVLPSRFFYAVRDRFLARHAPAKTSEVKRTE